MVGIYKITSPSGKIYIGQSWNIEKRWKTYFNSGCKDQPKLHNSFMKYGFKNHTKELLFIIDENESQGFLDIFEIYFINYYKKAGYELLNLKEGGGNGKFSEESKNKMSKSAKGKVLSEETRQKIGEKNRGRILSDETKRKISEKNKNKKISIETLQKMSEANKGKKISEETKRKISKAGIGRKHKQETRKKISDSNKKIILNTQTGIFYFGLEEAANSININKYTLKCWLNGNRRNKSVLKYV